MKDQERKEQKHNLEQLLLKYQEAVEQEQE